MLPKGGARHVVVDSTGVKVYGEWEWKMYNFTKGCATFKFVAYTSFTNMPHSGSCIKLLRHEFDSETRYVLSVQK
jgi:hypothetical protein